MAYRVLIAGGGVVALEATLALKDLAGDAVSITVLTAAPEFTYRPQRVGEPFGAPLARTYAWSELARDLGVELVPEAFHRLDAPNSEVHTDRGSVLGYDALLLGMGAQAKPAFPHVLTIDDRHLDEQLHGLIQDIEGGYVHSLALLAPNFPGWLLPVYELALMSARRAYEMQTPLAVTVLTPEDQPLEVFGDAASLSVRALLEENGVALITASRPSVPGPGQVCPHPGEAVLQVDRVLALPQLFGPSMSGVPAHAAGGFIAVDPYCRVKGLERVFAAGDAIDFPLKHGGLAAQQADTAARGIAALAGVELELEPLRPELDAVLIGGGVRLHLHARVSGSHGVASSIEALAPAGPEAKIGARYLSDYLHERDAYGAAAGSAQDE